MVKNDLFFKRGAAFFRSESALVHNAKTIMEHAHATRLIAVIKANAYGHGAVWAANVLSKKLAVHDFAVATLDEGITVREQLSSQQNQILLLGVQNPAMADVMAQHELSVAVGSMDWLLTAKNQLDQVDSIQPLKIHLAIDTGMGRMGARTKEDLSSMYEFVLSDSKFEFAGVFTHFATADDNNQAYYDQQKADFLGMVKSVGIDERYWHLANSGSALYHQNEIYTDTIRVGAALYGFNSAHPDRETMVPLQPVGAFQGKIWSVHKLLAGQAVSYGATYVASEDQWIGTVPVGYADGYHRNLSGMTVLINGQRQKVLGRVTMDQIIVSLPGPVALNTNVTLFGTDGQEKISLETLADYGQTIPHEILTEIGTRIPRVDVE
ncbi:alanine racemase [Fructobacillus ficulneus]|uniref:Alanine racemase n=1 Tax=Fructobacillus ficulneus TaxID=157463 RepID=A0A0K8MFS0_9LACO|nr:alanine racemase [Fructobacillus ficulneus]GAO99337.1 alanine racemase [Fructobacillus ficulneus]